MAKPRKTSWSRIIARFLWRHLIRPASLFALRRAKSYYARPEGRLSLVVLANAALLLTPWHRVTWALLPTLLVMLAHLAGLRRLDSALIFPFGTLLHGLTNLIKTKRLTARQRYAKPYAREITAFAQAHARESGRFPYPLPHPLHVSATNLATFHAFLKTRGFKRGTKFLRSLLEVEAREFSIREVERLIRLTSPHLNNTPEAFCEAYLNVFQEDLRFVPNLAALVAKSPRDLTHRLERQIKRRREQRNRNHLAQILAGGPATTIATLTQIDHLDGHAFEAFLEHFFRDMGFKVTPTRQTGDQGADLILEKFGYRIVVQAKCYSQNIGNGAVQEVVAAKGHYQCEHAMVVANQPFTKSAQDLARSNQVELWDRARLKKELQNYPQYL